MSRSRPFPRPPTARAYERAGAGRPRRRARVPRRRCGPVDFRLRGGPVVGSADRRSPSGPVDRDRGRPIGPWPRWSEARTANGMARPAPGSRDPGASRRGRAGDGRGVPGGRWARCSAQPSDRRDRTPSLMLSDRSPLRERRTRGRPQPARRMRRRRPERPCDPKRERVEKPVAFYDNRPVDSGRSARLRLGRGRLDRPARVPRHDAARGLRLPRRPRAAAVRAAPARRRSARFAREIAALPRGAGREAARSVACNAATSAALPQLQEELDGAGRRRDHARGPRGRAGDAQPADRAARARRRPSTPAATRELVRALDAGAERLSRSPARGSCR